MSNPNVAAGNPCKVLRKITDDDKKMLFRDEEIDEEAWADILERMEFEAADWTAPGIIPSTHSNQVIDKNE